MIPVPIAMTTIAIICTDASPVSLGKFTCGSVCMMSKPRRTTIPPAIKNGIAARLRMGIHSGDCDEAVVHDRLKTIDDVRVAKFHSTINLLPLPSAPQYSTNVDPAFARLSHGRIFRFSKSHKFRLNNQIGRTPCPGSRYPRSLPARNFPGLVFVAVKPVRLSAGVEPSSETAGKHCKSALPME